MAEEITTLSVTPNMTKLDGNNSRRNSTGKTICPKSGEQILPHYLRASTGSCHDFCKYGREHAFETKARHSIPRRVTKKANDRQISVEVEVAPVMKKASTAKIKQCPGSNTRSPNTPNEQHVMKKSLDSPNSVSSNVLAERKKISGSKLKTSPSPKSHLRPHETMKQEVSVESVSTEKLKISPKAEVKPPSAKSFSCLKPKSLAKKLVSSPESSGGLYRNNAVKIVGKRTGTSKLALKKASASPKVLLSPRPSLSTVASLNARKHQSLRKIGSLINQNEIKKSEFLQSKGNKVQQSKSKEVQQPKNDEVHQPMSDEVQQPKSNEVQEKTLYVIKMETENRCFESDRNEICADESLLPPSSSSPLPELSLVPSLPYCSSTEEEEDLEYTASESEDETFSVDSELEGAENTECQVGDEKRKLPKSGVVHTGEKDSQNLKLKFRRGKVVDVLSENNSSRRLKFRRGRVLGENQNMKECVRRRSFKRREGANDKSCETAPEKVVLRHQDVQGKMDAQGLFNNVIEETASKLAETRKSKVKALVGAFETVISLQDKKPATNNIA